MCWPAPSPYGVCADWTKCSSSLFLFCFGGPRSAPWLVLVLGLGCSSLHSNAGLQRKALVLSGSAADGRPSSSSSSFFVERGSRFTAGGRKGREGSRQEDREGRREDTRQRDEAGGRDARREGGREWPGGGKEGGRTEDWEGGREGRKDGYRQRAKVQSQPPQGGRWSDDGTEGPPALHGRYLPTGRWDGNSWAPSFLRARLYL